MKLFKIRKKRWIKWVLYALGIMIFAGLFFYLLVLWGAFGPIPDQKELQAYEQYKATQVFSSEGDLIGKIYAENRSDLRLDELPGYVKNTLVVTEDARFYEHDGVDLRSFLRVLVKSVLLGQDAGGGSTITQQLAKNMYGRKSYGPLTVPVAKTREIIIARRLEKVFNKDQILTLYLNQVPFGENIYGIESASQRFFDKEASDLRIEESAVLIGMLQANTAYNPRLHPEQSRHRRNVVLAQLAKYGYVTEHVRDSLLALPLELDYNNLDISGPAAYFLVQVHKEANSILEEINKERETAYDLKKDGLHIQTTLNTTTQDAALAAFRKHLSVMQKHLRDQYNRYGKRHLANLVSRELKKSGLEARADSQGVSDYFSWNGNYTDTLSVRDSLALDMTTLHAGLIGLEPSTGAVVAWVGGIDYTTWPYDQILAKRPLASTFKPVIYAAALEAGADPCKRLRNNTIRFADDEPEWDPSNYDKTSGGSYSMQGALVNSMNIPTIQLYRSTGYEKVSRMWRDLGFKSSMPEGLSAALGTADASLMELAVAYAAFANGGYRVEPYTIESITTRDGEVIYRKKSFVKMQVLSERTCTIMNHILGNAVEYGTGKRLRSTYGVRLPVSGKTGTSQEYADAWFAAYNSRIVMATRVGASSPRIHFNSKLGAGGRLALPLVGITLYKVQYTPTGRKWNKEFPELPKELERELDCPDFKEDNLLQEWIDRIRMGDRISQGREIEESESKDEPEAKEEPVKNFFDRLLNRK